MLYSFNICPSLYYVNLNICILYPSVKVKFTILQLLSLYVCVYFVCVCVCVCAGASVCSESYGQEKEQKMHVRIYLLIFSCVFILFLSDIKMFCMTKENFICGKLNIKRELNLDFRILTVT